MTDDWDIRQIEQQMSDDQAAALQARQEHEWHHPPVPSSWRDFRIQMGWVVAIFVLLPAVFIGLMMLLGG